MIVIADSNIFISSIYTPYGITADILTSKNNIQFLSPDFVLDEIRNHLSEIAEKSGKSKREIAVILKKITAKVVFYSADEIPESQIKKAIEIVRDIDIDDTFFVALHLHTKHKLWTGDKMLINGLKKKGYDICITTAQLKKSLYKK